MAVPGKTAEETQGEREGVKGSTRSILRGPSAGAVVGRGSFGKRVQLDETPRWSSARPWWPNQLLLLSVSVNLFLWLTEGMPWVKSSKSVL